MAPLPPKNHDEFALALRSRIAIYVREEFWLKRDLMLFISYYNSVEVSDADVE